MKTELSNYTVTWRLPEYNFDRAFTIVVEAESATDALEVMFTVANGMAPDTPDGQRWAAMQHRSLSVGDNVNVNGQPWHCAGQGWDPSTETDSWSMEDHLARTYGLDVPVAEARGADGDGWAL